MFALKLRIWKKSMLDKFVIQEVVSRNLFIMNKSNWIILKEK